mgnify:CR=1 FL=1
MHIQTNSNSSLDVDERLQLWMKESLESELDRFSDQITHIEVHLSDVNSLKGGRDKRCLLEARLAGMDPIAVSDQAETLEIAVHGATDKLKKSLDSAIGRLGARS